MQHRPYVHHRRRRADRGDAPARSRRQRTTAPAASGTPAVRGRPAGRIPVAVREAFHHPHRLAVHQLVQFDAAHRVGQRPLEAGHGQLTGRRGLRQVLRGLDPGQQTGEELLGAQPRITTAPCRATSSAARPRGPSGAHQNTGQRRVARRSKQETSAWSHWADQPQSCPPPPPAPARGDGRSRWSAPPVSTRAPPAGPPPGAPPPAARALPAGRSRRARRARSSRAAACAGRRGCHPAPPAGPE